MEQEKLTGLKSSFEEVKNEIRSGLSQVKNEKSLEVYLSSFFKTYSSAARNKVVQKESEIVGRENKPGSAAFEQSDERFFFSKVDTVVGTEVFDLNLKNIPEPVEIRLSVVFQIFQDEWQVIHLHASSFNRSKTCAESELQKINTSLEKQLKERTNSLNEALKMLKLNQAQMLRQEKMASLGQLTAGIAHEIKNPLNFITNFSELSVEFIDEISEHLEKLEKNEARDEIDLLLKDVKSNLFKIYEHGSRADGIVKSMLLHSRGGSGNFEPVDLNDLVREYVNLSFHGMRANKNPINVQIELDLDENLGLVRVNSESLSRVILNLCKNAFDAMREKLERHKKEVAVSRLEGGTLIDEYSPKLTVRTKKQPGGVMLEIEDNGPGVPDAIKDKLMMPFFTTKKGSEGTGLGLSITSDIVQAHKGELEIQSEEDLFTRFRILLPGDQKN